MNDKLNNYSRYNANLWKGRVDDPADPESFRIHQIVKPLNLNKSSAIEDSPGELKVCILGFKCDEGVRRNLGRTGAAKGPEMIREQLSNLPVTFGNKLNVYDAGDIYCVENKLEFAQRELSLAVKNILTRNMFPVILGGGHETALGNFNGILEFQADKKNNSGTGIVNFDAHLDFRPFGSGGSSGSMFYQIAEERIKKNLDFKYLCVGAQTYSNTISLFKRAESFGGQIILAKDMGEENYPEVERKIDHFIQKTERIHLTICCDVFNAANAPGVSAPQPFGLDPEIVLKLVKYILRSGKVLSLDIAEVSPRFDNDNITAKLAAVLIFAVLNTLSENR